MNTITHTKRVRDRSVVEKWSRPDGYTISVRTYHYADRKAFSVSIGSSVMIDHGTYVTERFSLYGDPIAQRLAVQRVDRYSERKLVELHDATVTPDLVEKIETMLQEHAPVTE